jgi:hypothetical protein
VPLTEKRAVHQHKLLQAIRKYRRSPYRISLVYWLPAIAFEPPEALLANPLKLVTFRFKPLINGFMFRVINTVKPSNARFGPFLRHWEQVAE